MKLNRLSFNELSNAQLYQILRLRNEVFVVEQTCVYQDCDGKDLVAEHLFYEEEGKILAYLRILPRGVSCEEVSFGRILVSPAFRGTGLAKTLIKEALRYATEEMKASSVRIFAQLYLKKFYESLGFVVVSEPYEEDGIAHIEMVSEHRNLALVIIDVQVAMFEYDGGVFEKEKVLSNLVKLQEVAREAGVPIVKVQHTELGSEFDPQEATWAIHPSLEVEEGELWIEKTHCDAFFKTPLSQKLEERGIKKLLIVGMQTEYCMDTTIRNAFSRGYKVYGVKGGHTTFSNGQMLASEIIKYHEALWDNRFLELLDLESAVKLLKQEG